MREQFSHTHKPTGEIIFLYNLIFTVQISDGKIKVSELHGSIPCILIPSQCPIECNLNLLSVVPKYFNCVYSQRVHFVLLEYTRRGNFYYGALYGDLRYKQKQLLTNTQCFQIHFTAQ